MVGVLTLTVRPLLGQPDGDGLVEAVGVADALGDGEALATTLRQPLQASLVAPSVSSTVTLRAPAVASAAAAIVTTSFSGLVNVTPVTVRPVPLKVSVAPLEKLVPVAVKDLVSP